MQDLVDSVCDRVGVDPATMRNLDIDSVVNRAIDVKEGTLPPWSHRRVGISDRKFLMHWFFGKFERTTKREFPVFLDVPYIRATL